MAEQVEAIEKLLRRVLRRADYHIQTAEDEANQLADKHTITGAVASATAAAHGIFGDSDLAEVRDMAAERIRDDYEKRLGELQTLIDLTDFDHAVDLNQMAFRQEGLEQLAAAEKKVTQAEREIPEGGPRGVPAASGAPALPSGGGGETPRGGSEAGGADRWRSRLRRPQS